MNIEVTNLLLFEMIVGILIILCLSAFILGKVRKDLSRNNLTQLYIDSITFDNINLSVLKFSPHTIEFIKEITLYPERFRTDTCVIKYKESEIAIWTENDISSRRFYTHNVNLKDKVNEMNKTLSNDDYLLLDRVCKEFKKTEEERRRLILDSNISDLIL